MEFALQIRQHPNARYYESLTALSENELRCMLIACDIPAQMVIRKLGGADFLCFEAEALSCEQFSFICEHSARALICTVENGLLRPLDVPNTTFLPPDMPDILKYKGKTNVAFTHMLINLALSAAGYTKSDSTLSLLDPLCGRGTTLFCALSRGMNACGVEIDEKELKEGQQFVSRYLQYHKVKHRTTASGLTIQNGKSAPETTYAITHDGITRTLCMARADTLALPQLFPKPRFHLLVADLPYGVQHAPHTEQRQNPIAALIANALRGWHATMYPGGALALSFNTYTLDRAFLLSALARAGFTPMDAPPYHRFEHWVEQAVNRDVVVAKA